MLDVEKASIEQIELDSVICLAINEKYVEQLAVINKCMGLSMITH
jgi:hypothetical protein